MPNKYRIQAKAKLRKLKKTKKKICQIRLEKAK